MPTLAAGNKSAPTPYAIGPRRQTARNGGYRGFTLLELLLVISIVAVVSAGVAVALPDSGASRLETQAQRLIALLESARAQSRTLGIPIYWRATPQGFVWEGIPSKMPDALPTGWQGSGLSASSAEPIVLGPEPVIPAQSVRIWLTEQPSTALLLSSDGVRPFSVQRNAP